MGGVRLNGHQAQITYDALIRLTALTADGLEEAFEWDENDQKVFGQLLTKLAVAGAKESA
jgi:hypothetical protein